MKKAKIFASVTAALALVAATAIADEAMEKCVVNKDGKSLIKPHKGDCSTSKYSCGGQNSANDLQSWIFVPKGQCEKINAGDYSGISKETKEKIAGAS